MTEKEKYFSIFQFAAIPATISKSADNTFIDVNPAFEKVFGFTRDEVLGKTTLQLGMVKPEEREETIREMEDQSTLINRERHLYTKKGEPIFALVNINRFESDGEQLVISTIQDITGRKCMEEALSITMERLELAASSAQIGVWDWDMRRNRITWDDRMFSLYGLKRKGTKTTFETWKKALHPDDHNAGVKVLQDAIDKNLEYDTEFRILWPDKSEHWIKANGKISRDHEGKPYRMVGINYDITREVLGVNHLKQTQEKLIVSERNLNLFVQYAPASIAMFDKEMRYLAVSKRFISDYRLNHVDLIGHSHYEIFPEITERWKAIHRRCLAGAVEKDEKDPFIRINGELDWIRWEIHPWYEKEGSIGGIILFSEVITERILTEDELKRSENRFRSMLETMLEGCQIMDFNWRYVYLNATAEIHNRIPRSAVLGRTYTEVWPGIEKTNVYAVIKKCLEERIATHMENEFTYPSGAVGWFELSIQPMPEGVFILSVDISERKKAEQEVAKMNERLELKVVERTRQLEIANKELESFSYSVSHDLRAPLRAMAGFARILKEDYLNILDEEGRRLLQIIIENAKKMGTLIDDLLAFAQLGKHQTHLTRINMQDMALGVYDEIASQNTKEEVKLILHDLPDAYADTAMVKQVWINLIGNAIKFSSGKSDRLIEIGSEKNVNENIYYVRDNGAGFNMMYVNKLYGVFQRLHAASEFEGTGVGLAIVKRIITRLKGRVWAEGRENEGATFYFTLPAEMIPE